MKAGVEAGVRLGLGKQQEDDKYTDAESITRKKLEVELQAEEDPERTKRREVQAVMYHSLRLCRLGCVYLSSSRQCQLYSAVA